MSLVEVKRIEKNKWHGKTGRDSFSRPITIEALVSLRTGQFATGLSKEDRDRLEAITGYDLSPDYMQGKPHAFWSTPTASIKLDQKTNMFNSNIPLDEIKIKVMKAHDLVANSMKEFEDGLFPDALYVIYDEKEEIEVKASKATIKRNVIIEASKLTKVRKADIVQILTGISVRTQSENYVDLKLDDCIEKEGAEKVLILINRDNTRTTVHAMVLEGLYKNVLRKEGTAVYYMDDQLGFDVESAIDYFIDTKNQTMKAQLIEKLL